MDENLQKKIQKALKNPQNMGELEGADSIGTVGNSECGEMLRMWIKYKEEKGKKVIDRATFQSFGCETAIAVASLATELVKGKTPEEALAMKPEELSGELGPLPPMKIHCAQLVEGALRSALNPNESPAESNAVPQDTPPNHPPSPTLMDSLNQGSSQKQGLKIRFLDSKKDQEKETD